jgi:hypothetical protein
MNKIRSPDLVQTSRGWAEVLRRLPLSVKLQRLSSPFGTERRRLIHSLQLTILVQIAAVDWDRF